jgi:hypothetical protein
LGFFYGKPATCKPFAVSHQVFTAFCLPSWTRKGHLFFLDEPGKQKKDFLAVFAPNCKACSQAVVSTVCGV